MADLQLVPRPAASADLIPVASGLDPLLLRFIEAFISAATVADGSRAALQILATGSRLPADLRSGSAWIDRLTDGSDGSVGLDVFVAEATRFVDPSRSPFWRKCLDAAQQSGAEEIFVRRVLPTLFTRFAEIVPSGAGSERFAQGVEEARIRIDQCFDRADRLLGSAALHQTAVRHEIEKWLAAVEDRAERVMAHEMLCAPIAELKDRLDVLRDAVVRVQSEAGGRGTEFGGDSAAGFFLWAQSKVHQVVNPIGNLARSYTELVGAAPGTPNSLSAANLHRSLRWFAVDRPDQVAAGPARDFATILHLLRNAPREVRLAFAALRKIDLDDAAAVDQAFEDLHIRMTIYLIPNARSQFRITTGSTQDRFATDVVLSVYALAVGHLRAIQRQILAAENVDADACTFCGKLLVRANTISFERILGGEFTSVDSLMADLAREVSDAIETIPAARNFRRLMCVARGFDRLTAAVTGATPLINHFPPGVRVIQRWGGAVVRAAEAGNFDEAKAMVDERRKFDGTLSGEEFLAMSTEQAGLTACLDAVWEREGRLLCENLHALADKKDGDTENDALALRSLVEGLVSNRRWQRVASWQQIDATVTSRQRIVAMYRALAAVIAKRPELIQPVLAALTAEIEAMAADSSSLSDSKQLRLDIKVWDVLRRAVLKHGAKSEEDLLEVLNSLEERYQSDVEAARGAVGWRSLLRRTAEAIEKIADPGLRKELQQIFSPPPTTTVAPPTPRPRSDGSTTSLVVRQVIPQEVLATVEPFQPLRDPKKVVTTDAKSADPDHVREATSRIRQLLNTSVAHQFAVGRIVNGGQVPSIRLAAQARGSSTTEIRPTQNGAVEIAIPDRAEILGSVNYIRTSRMLIQAVKSVSPAKQNGGRAHRSAERERDAAARTQAAVSEVVAAFERRIGLWNPNGPEFSIAMAFMSALGQYSHDRELAAVDVDAVLRLYSPATRQSSTSNIAGSEAALDAFAQAFAGDSIPRDMGRVVMSARIMVRTAKAESIMRSLHAVRESVRHGYSGSVVVGVLNAGRSAFDNLLHRAPNSPVVFFDRGLKVLMTTAVRVQGVGVYDGSAATGRAVLKFVQQEIPPFSQEILARTEGRICHPPHLDVLSTCADDLRRAAKHYRKWQRHAGEPSVSLGGGFSSPDPSAALVGAINQIADLLDQAAQRFDQYSIAAKVLSRSPTPACTPAEFVALLHHAVANPADTGAVQQIARLTVAGYSGDHPWMVLLTDALPSTEPGQTPIQGDLLVAAVGLNSSIATSAARDTRILRALCLASLQATAECVRGSQTASAPTPTAESNRLVTEVTRLFQPSAVWSKAEQRRMDDRLRDLEMNAQIASLRIAAMTNDGSTIAEAIVSAEEWLNRTPLRRDEDDPLREAVSDAVEIVVNVVIADDVQVLDETLTRPEIGELPERCAEIHAKVSRIRSATCRRAAATHLAGRTAAIGSRVDDAYWSPVATAAERKDPVAWSAALIDYSRQRERFDHLGLPLPGRDYGQSVRALTQKLGSGWSALFIAAVAERRYKDVREGVREMLVFCQQLPANSDLRVAVTAEAQDRQKAMVAALHQLALDDAHHADPKTAKESRSAYADQVAQLNPSANAETALEKVILNRFLSPVNGAHARQDDAGVIEAAQALVAAASPSRVGSSTVKRALTSLEAAHPNAPGPLRTETILQCWKLVGNRLGPVLAGEYERAASRLAVAVVEDVGRKFEQLMDESADFPPTEFGKYVLEWLDYAASLRADHRLFAITTIHQLAHRAASAATALEQYLTVYPRHRMIPHTGLRPADLTELMSHPVLELAEMIRVLDQWRAAAKKHGAEGEQTQVEFDRSLTYLTRRLFFSPYAEAGQRLLADAAPGLQTPDDGPSTSLTLTQPWPAVQERLEVLAPYLELASQHGCGDPGILAELRKIGRLLEWAAESEVLELNLTVEKILDALPLDDKRTGSPVPAEP